MILWLMLNITFSMILCALHIYHIAYRFPAAQIRFLANAEIQPVFGETLDELTPTAYSSS